MKRASEMIDQIQRAAALRNKPSNDSYTPIPNEQPLPILTNQPLPPSPKQAQFVQPYSPSPSYPPEDTFGVQPIQQPRYNSPGHIPAIYSPVPTKPPSQGTPYVQQPIPVQLPVIYRTFFPLI